MGDSFVQILHEPPTENWSTGGHSADLKADPGVLLALPKFWAGEKQGDHHGNVGKNQANVCARQAVAA